jgi:subtilisin family serine protease
VRSLRSGWLLGVLLCVAASAAGAQQPAFDPLLRMLLRPEVRQTVEAALRAEPLALPRDRALGGGVALDAEGPMGTARVGVFVKLRTPAALAELRAAGAEIGVVAGDIASARVPLAALPALSAAVGIERVEAALVVERSNELAASLVRADRVRDLVGNAWQGFAGQGIVVGIYDTGLDYLHEDFRTGEGQTRLFGLWDQTLGGTPPMGFAGGHLCDVASLDARICPQRDNNGHGTHVAGSAAGGGRAVANRHAGIAPAADLLIVKGGEATFAEDRIINGIAWIFAEAERRGRPAVVNLSLGSQFGPHDGTRLYEQAIDNLSGPGRIVVTSSGNDGANASAGVIPPLIHGMATPAAGVAQTFVFNVPQYSPQPGAGANHLRISFWYAGADRLTIAIVRPDGSTVTAVYGQETLGASPLGGIYIDNASAGPAPENGDHEAFILIENLVGSGPPMVGPWTIRVTPEAVAAGRPYHFWFFANSINARGVQGFTNSHLVSSPGTARRTIAVGAYVQRLQWLSTDGNTYSFQVPDEAVGDIAQFSSGGPTRDGRLKPEITAPGRVVVSSLSGHASVPTPLIVPGGRHWVLQGTSMAAPMVAGGVALLLQRAPSLTPENVQQILSTASIRDQFVARTYVTGDPGGIPNFTWGHGKLDVEAAIQAAAIFARASILAVTAAPVEHPAPPTTQRGSRLALLRLNLTADGPEALDVNTLGFRLFGQDPGARLLVVCEPEGSTVACPADPVLGAVAAPLQPDDSIAVLVPLALRIPAGQTVAVVAALEMSGAAPHQASFRAAFLPTETRATGVETGQPSPLRQPAGPVQSPEVEATLLQPEELFALSENPVRSSRVVFNFRSAPTLAAVFTVSGRQVVDLLPLLEGEARIVWNLTNQQGTALAAGIYLVVFRIEDRLVREKLIIARPTGGRD